jgi:hypothetical protein
MIAGSVANNFGLHVRRLHLIPVEKGAHCWSSGFPLQVTTNSRTPSCYGPRNTRPIRVTRSKLKICSRGLSEQRPTIRRGKSGEPSLR